MGAKESEGLCHLDTDGTRTNDDHAWRQLGKVEKSAIRHVGHIAEAHAHACYVDQTQLRWNGANSKGTSDPE